MKKNILYLSTILLLLSSPPAFAQNYSRDTRSYFDYGEQIYANVSQSATSREAYITLNTANALFSFVRTTKELQPRGAYYAIRDIAIELRERPSGDIISTKSIRDTIFAVNFEETTNKQRWHSLLVTLPINRSKATNTKLEAHIEVRDGFLVRLAARAITLPFDLRPFHIKRSVTERDTAFVGISDPFLFDTRIDENNYLSNNWGKTYGFSRDITGVFALARDSATSIADSIVLTLYRTQSIFEEKPSTPVVVSEQTIGKERIQDDLTLVPISAADSQIVFSLKTPPADSGIRYSAVLFSLPGKKLLPGKYTLTAKLFTNGITRTISTEYKIEWHGMPLSLDDPKDAIPPLEHIMTNEEYSSISSGSKFEQLKKLYDFWGKQDPTPETAYNERMAEFYRRADYAYFNFARSSRLLDGAMTDRGKIYILYGSPTSIERSLLIGEQPVEVWTYRNNVKKIFRFVDESGRADYKLAEVKPIP